MGCGSVLNTNGEVEMDASIMDGKDLSTGAVSAVRGIANPIKLARLVMEKTPHCFLTHHGAAQFAAAMGVPEIPAEKLITERNKKRLEKEKREKDAQKTDCQKRAPSDAKFLSQAPQIPDTIQLLFSLHSVVQLASAGFRPDHGVTPGSGGYADSNIGAISTTGHGESILKVNLARLTLFHMEQGKTVEEAADLSLGYMKSRVKGLGGLILVSKTGDWVAKWTTTSMPWAAAKDGKLHFGIDPGDTTITDLA
ncbi:Isoaspartyl peptidase/L-asparaginase [Saguinus oedipus]|uniref:Isoaspartyl peptidase/L-asparaginase n=1 Tax=Saguinus oedipus TaxID=9490 RepID=A0ABQ9UU41_SAGOE|nr:Isoaspartyl peptidase/L-asparaginase [Saguinus oedipus]